VLEEREIMSVGNARRSQSSTVSNINKEGVSITLEAAGVRAGDLLLLEEGPISRKGFTKLMVYLWVDDINKLTAPAPQIVPLLPGQDKGQKGVPVKGGVSNVSKVDGRVKKEEKALAKKNAKSAPVNNVKKNGFDLLDSDDDEEEEKTEADLAAAKPLSREGRKEAEKKELERLAEKKELEKKEAEQRKKERLEVHICL
jgi:hypothetical protein